MIRMVKRIFEDNNEREVRRLSKIAAKIDSMEFNISKLDDDQLKAKTAEFQMRLSKREQLTDILPEAFAVVREASRRVLFMRPFTVQIMGGIALFEGKIVEMKTGEGKTLVGTLPVYLNALAGNGVHVVTVNDYLAQRDSREMGQLFRFLGLSVGCTLNGTGLEMKRRAYACDITYGTCSEFGFDYLRDHMALFEDQTVQRPPNYVIIDEVDSILIDEARTPLIISGKAQRSTYLYNKADRFAGRLEEDDDFTIDSRMETIVLTEASVRKAEQEFEVDNLFSQEHMLLNHHINQALRARHMLKRNVDYVVQDNEILIVDEFTGRLMLGRRYSDGLHQAIEAKEGLDLQNESMMQASITLQNYFRVYPRLAGMTGTARTEEGEFKHVYGRDVVEIPTNRPNIRKDHPDVIYKTVNGKYKALIEEITRRHKCGQPVLVGTVSIEGSEFISAALHEKGVKHRVLHAMLHAEEAEIIRNAGQRGAVTISTNMAGRGTDINLGDGVPELGGLHVIGTERHESRRIDNQLRGRAGRQGDPGSTQFYLSMEDGLMRRFGSQQLTDMLEKYGFSEELPLEGSLISRSIESAQRIVEGANFESLKMVLQYDEVVNRQRERIYRDREEILQSDHIRGIVIAMIRSLVERVVDKHCPSEEIPEKWDISLLADYVNLVLFSDDQISSSQLWGKEKDEIIRFFMDMIIDVYEERETRIGKIAMRQFEKFIVLRAVDSKWIDHIDAMDQLRQGILLRVYGGNDPLQEYQFEGHEMFLDMVRRLEEEVCRYIMKVKISENVRPAHAG
ncbi:preprotein translocase subunit SecA [Paenibacillus luteus]|uniref:preprotein translocase subunit SecA n=1 Tax=Paenibacillus luteus TaxID=2545753 RepID=UPI0011450EBC|nr:preprotein translocase subunit SecA [Paenibacillus luteus]